jgi:DNA-directed RNA polymerase subunit alpha
MATTTHIDLRGLVRPTLVEMTKRDDQPHVAEFRIQPLERGYGHTLGNAMRRMLLSSLRGSAVWAFRIDGVVHEHQTIPGVVEDVHQIIANLKSLTLAIEDDREDVVLRIGARGAGVVTAAMIEAPPGVRVFAPEHHILTVTDDRDLNIELFVNRGRGYVEADQHVIDRSKSSVPAGLVRIDSLYSPVRRANFTVAETRVGQRTDYDRLALVVETNGTIAPEEAVSYAAALAQTHFQYFAAFGSSKAAADGISGRVLAKLLETPIESFDLSVRAVNSLKNSEIRTLGDLVRLTEDQIGKIRNFGVQSLKEVIRLLEQHKLNFGMSFLEDETEGMIIVRHGTPPSHAAEQVRIPDETDTTGEDGATQPVVE